MRTVLISGGNKGLGYETARQLSEQGYQVIIGSRSIERGQRAANQLNVELIELDVSSDESVRQAAELIAKKYGRLDILINNAGISGGFKKPAEMTTDDIYPVYNTNVFGIVRMMHAFTPLLNKSGQPVVVNVSSGLGSFGMVTNSDTEESKVNSLAYCSSKSAVTMLTIQYAKSLTHMQINAADPGPTNTDLVGDFSNNSKPASDGVIPIVKLATIDKDGPTGTFINQEGTMPW
ncbi:SDR family NAD(P)-dependent oxidoreductase [Staphylococcus sp. SQ8-PEA]|uniref:SDR family NAD(P)-dependent oxidoreductase n=1 Tax=Staphylococcus marylandisciuri TaxID=2981529 RepID=A0ABT2QN50_9STAP|nr:SDR family NAD(P)-dependent oxidoreductase [Staphylococcus marylandisciuri]MCU5745385.1 SDR family NAD(P)-dependent oxidoreductase [Staphylococcus marylandisciuri]